MTYVIQDLIHQQSILITLSAIISFFDLRQVRELDEKINTTVISVH